ncbi:MAG: DivIVA domain-containing protein [Deltaproteobacteria bacterium]
MKLMPMEIKSHALKKAFFGYDMREVEALKDLASEALEDALKQISALEDRYNDTVKKLSEHLENERLLKEAITTAQRMVEELKGNARKEAELLITEARLQAEEIVRQAHHRAKEIQGDIFRLKKQRIEMETTLKALLDYHSQRLVLEEDHSRKADEDAGKLAFLPKS